MDPPAWHVLPHLLLATALNNHHHMDLFRIRTMEGSQPQLPPSEAELGDFLEDILFSPEGGGLNPHLLLDEFDNPNPLDPASIAVSDANAAAPRHSQPPMQMNSNPVSKGKSAEVLQALAKSAAEQKPAAQESVKPAKDSTQAASKKPSTRVIDDKSLVLPGEVKPKDILCIRGMSTMLLRTCSENSLLQAKLTSIR